jgi:predicted MPP superfamily phosphohydrolase
MRNYMGPLIIIAVLLVVDWYTFHGLRQVAGGLSTKVKRVLAIVYWIPTVVMLILMVLMIMNGNAGNSKPPQWFFQIFSFIFILSLSKLVFVLFHLGSDVIHGIRFVWSKWINKNQVDGLQRIQFINQLGLAMSGLMMGSLVYGVVKGKYNFKVHHSEIKFKDLPKEWDGLKIVQISDAHLGTFGADGVDDVAQAIYLINEINPDIIFFTGDLVNNLAEEAEPYIELFHQLKAKYGKFSILGNHDYAYYVYRGDDPESVRLRQVNMEQLESVHERMGFKLLKNQTEKITILGKNLNILGLENWGRHFFQFGNLQATMKDVPNDEFKILLSHDPTHFEDQVMGKVPIQLTLSGHTHGAQFGVEIPDWNVKWSPSAYLGYKRWGGMYQENEQVLYVNRGLGCLGFPGRVGIMPEITSLVLKSKG